jgi:hypothetical protein
MYVNMPQLSVLVSNLNFMQSRAFKIGIVPYDVAYYPPDHHFKQTQMHIKCSLLGTSQF